MEIKSIMRIPAISAFILFVPLVAMRFTDEVAWTFTDFVFAWVLLACVGLAYKLATRQANLAYRAAIGVALATAFVLVWIDLAVGIIGSGDNPANLMYFGVLAAGVVGACLARLKARGMTRVLLATALAQALVPAISVVAGQPFDIAKAFGFNAVFVLLFVGAALLFQKSAADARLGERTARGSRAG